MSAPIIPIRPGIVIPISSDEVCDCGRQKSQLTQETSPEEGGVEVDMLCPDCRELIQGTYLPMFRCPECEVAIFLDEDGELIAHERNTGHVCDECGAANREMVTVCMENDVQKFVRKADDYIRRLFI